MNMTDGALYHYLTTEQKPWGFGLSALFEDSLSLAWTPFRLF